MYRLILFEFVETILLLIALNVNAIIQAIKLLEAYT